MPGGPVGPASRWAATSNVGQTTYPVNMGSVVTDERKMERGTKSQSGGRGRREWNGAGVMGP